MAFKNSRFTLGYLINEYTPNPLFYKNTYVPFSYASYLWKSKTRVMNCEVQVQIYKLRAFNLPTRAFNLSIRAFSLQTREFELVTRGFELVTRRFELVTRGFELVTRGFELVTRGFELVTRGPDFMRVHFIRIVMVKKC